MPTHLNGVIKVKNNQHLTVFTRPELQKSFWDLQWVGGEDGQIQAHAAGPLEMRWR